MPGVRKASHAGSWYEGVQTKLSRSIKDWMRLAQADIEPEASLKAIIGPHAGYSYCGAVMAHAYAGIDPASV